MLLINLEKIFSLKRELKILLQVIADIIIITFCYLFSFYLRLDDTFFLSDKNILSVIPVLHLITLIIFLFH